MVDMLLCAPIESQDSMVREDPIARDGIDGKWTFSNTDSHCMVNLVVLLGFEIVSTSTCVFVHR